MVIVIIDLEMSGILRNTAKRCIYSVRNFTKNSIRFEKSATTTPTTTPKVSSVVEEIQRTGKLSGKTHRVNNLEKRFLVWSGKFKSVDEVPSLLAPETVEKARNKARIRLANIMMLMTAIACLGMVISGKRAAERGESVQKANLEWHKRVNEESAKSKSA